MMLTTYEPQYEDLWFKQQMMADAETMAYNRAYGGTIPFPEEKWPEWYRKWITGSRGQRYYRYLKDGSGAFIGEISFRCDDAYCNCMVDVVIYAPHRGKGYGTQALEMLCAAAKENGVQAVYDEIAIDNPAVGLFLRHGFSEEYRTESTVMLKREL